MAVEHQQNQEILEKLVMESALGKEYLVNAQIRKVIHNPNVQFKGATTALLNFVVQKDKTKLKKKSSKS